MVFVVVISHYIFAVQSFSHNIMELYEYAIIVAAVLILLAAMYGVVSYLAKPAEHLAFRAQHLIGRPKR